MTKMQATTETYIYYTVFITVPKVEKLLEEILDIYKRMEVEHKQKASYLYANLHERRPSYYV